MITTTPSFSFFSPGDLNVTIALDCRGALAGATDTVAAVNSISAPDGSGVTFGSPSINGAPYTPTAWTSAIPTGQAILVLVSVAANLQAATVTATVQYVTTSGATINRNFILPVKSI